MLPGKRQGSKPCLVAPYIVILRYIWNDDDSKKKNQPIPFLRLAYTGIGFYIVNDLNIPWRTSSTACTMEEI